MNEQRETEVSLRNLLSSSAASIDYGETVLKLLRVGCFAAAVLVAAPSFAQQDYPSRPIRLIVPYPPGGPTDIMGRLTSEVLSKRLSQNVVVDNRGGAATAIGAEMAARAPADGYTVLVSSETTFAVTPALLLSAIVLAALIGLLGGIFPAIRAARLPIAAALREM